MFLKTRWLKIQTIFLTTTVSQICAVCTGCKWYDSNSLLEYNIQVNLCGAKLLINNSEDIFT